MKQKLCISSKNCAPNWEQARIGYPNFIEEPKILGSLCYFVSYCFLDTLLPYISLFYVINMADEESCERKIL